MLTLTLALSLNPDGLSDPLVKVRLHSRDGKELHRAETAVIKKTLSPQWGKRFRFRGKLRNYVHGMLELKVRNSDRGLALDQPCRSPSPSPNTNPDPTLTLSVTLPGPDQ